MNAKQIIKREIKAAAKAGEFSRFEVREDDIGGSVAIYGRDKFLCVLAGSRSQAWSLINSVICTA
jgi:hypothetical protein